MDLSIVIVNWNTRDFLRRCLESVQKDEARLENFEIETIVVDNASNDGSREMLREHFRWVQLVFNDDNAGFAKANNQGIRQSSSRHILLLNSDTEIHAGALNTLISFLDDNPQAGAAGARLLNPDGTLQPGCHPMLTPGREFYRLLFLDKIYLRTSYPMDSWDNRTSRRVEVIKGACLMLRREALDQVGLLDERYHIYTEEVDLCYRLDREGWQLWYVPTAVVTHRGGASSSQNAERMYLELHRSKIQFYRKIGGAGLARRFKVLLTLAYLPRAVLQPKNSTYRQLLARLWVM
jgi:GT2 family glycosyltransferase